VDGSPSKVEFFADGNLIGTDTSGPFNLIWSNAPVGVHVLTARVTDNVGLTKVSAPVSLSVINGQAPFYGVPQTIPGIIQAEDFDGGGEGVAYHDTDTSNNGNQYRATSVDIENTGDAGGGYNVGWTAGGEWLKYTVNATVDGIYSISTRAASPNNGTLIHVEIDGQNVTGSMSVTNTGNWQIYQTLTKTNISISAGQHQVQLSEDTGGGNYNYLTFTATSTCPGTPTYKFWVQAPGGSWTVVQGYGTSNTFVWDTTGLAAGVYNIEVEGNHSYFVSSSQILVHNASLSGLSARSLTAADLGIEGSITKLDATLLVAENIATVRVGMIEGVIKNPLQIVETLKNLAKSNGAQTLRIEGTLANPRLMDVLIRRYGLTTTGGTDAIEIPLGVR